MSSNMKVITEHTYPFLDIFVNMLMPLRHRMFLVIPVAIAFLALVFYGSLAIRTVMVAAAFIVTLAVFSVTLNHMLRFLVPWLCVLLSTVVAVACAVVAAQSAASGGVGAGATTLLGFALGAVIAGMADALGAGFAFAVPNHYALGEGCAVVAAGLIGARFAGLAPEHTAAAATALVGAYGFAACVRVVASASPDVVNPGVAPKAEAALTLILGIVGFGTQTCCLIRRRANSDPRGAQRGSAPYEEI
jgi:hypothetical protein